MDDSTAARIELADSMRAKIRAHMEDQNPKMTAKQFAELVNVPLPTLQSFLRSKCHSTSIVYFYSEIFFDYGVAPIVSFEETKVLLAEDMRTRIKG
jgi:hypothetical protein